MDCHHSKLAHGSWLDDRYNRTRLVVFMPNPMAKDRKNREEAVTQLQIVSFTSVFAIARAHSTKGTQRQRC